MRPPVVFLFFLLTCSYGWNSPALAQQGSPAANPVTSPVQEAIALYHQTLGRNAPLYSGPEYIEYLKQTDGHQYFKTDEWERGSIMFDGVLYPNVPILFDIVKSAVIIGYAEETDPLVKFVLVPDQVPYFTVSGSRFVHLRDSAGSLAPGFYEQLHQGQVGLFARRIKRATERPANISFQEVSRYYLYKDGAYHQVKSKGSVLKVLKEHRNELTALLQKENLTAKEHREKAITRMVQHYDHLSRPK